MIALVVVVVGVCAGIGVYGWVLRQHREAAIERARQARTPLQKSAADIDLARRNGDGIHFAVVPERLPPGLVEMWPLKEVPDDGVTDVYSFGHLKAVVKYTDVPGGRPCGEHACVRDTEVGFTTSEAPNLRHASIWLAGQASSVRQEAEVRQFWAETTWVPTVEAGWFTKLAYEGDVG
jgi:hypothetical protein